jgi:hypothetical protein
LATGSEVRSRATSRFWHGYAELPPDVQNLARKTYDLWRQNPAHPALHFKKLQGGMERFSVRVGIHYRAIGHLIPGGVEWVWIGSHAAYDKLLRRL